MQAAEHIFIIVNIPQNQIVISNLIVYYLFIYYLIGQVKLKFTVYRLTFNRISSFCFRGVCFWSTLALPHCSLTDVFSQESMFNLNNHKKCVLLVCGDISVPAE